MLFRRNVYSLISTSDRFVLFEAKRTICGVAWSDKMNFISYCRRFDCLIPLTDSDSQPYHPCVFQSAYLLVFLEKIFNRFFCLPCVLAHCFVLHKKLTVVPDKLRKAGVLLGLLDSCLQLTPNIYKLHYKQHFPVLSFV